MVDGTFCQIFDYIYIIFIWLWLVEQVAGVQKSLSDIDFDLGELHNMVSGLVSFPSDWWCYQFIAFTMSSIFPLYFHGHAKSFFSITASDFQWVMSNSLDLVFTEKNMTLKDITY